MHFNIFMILYHIDKPLLALNHLLQKYWQGHYVRVSMISLICKNKFLANKKHFTVLY